MATPLKRLLIALLAIAAPLGSALATWPENHLPSWNGVVVPAATPKDVTATMNASNNDGSRHPAMVKRRKERNDNPMITPPERARRTILDERARWRDVNAQVKLVPEQTRESLT